MAELILTPEGDRLARTAGIIGRVRHGDHEGYRPQSGGRGSLPPEIAAAVAKGINQGCMTAQSSYQVM